MNIVFQISLIPQLLRLGVVRNIRLAMRVP